MHTCDLLLLWFMSAQGVKVTRGGPVDVTRLTQMINTVYKKGEEGIISDTAERPFSRFMESDVQGLLDADALLLACSTAEEVVGCVKLDLGVSQDGLPAGERVGEWGGLAVGDAHQGRGVASALVSAAEAELRAAGCTLAQLELRQAYKAAGNDKTKSKYQNKVYLLPKELDEKVARLHLGQLGANLTVLSKEQAEYIGVAVDGPYKPATYRY